MLIQGAIANKAQNQDLPPSSLVPEVIFLANQGMQ